MTISRRCGPSSTANRRNLDFDDARLADIEVEIEEGGLQGRRYFSGPRRVAPRVRRPIIRSVARAASRFFGIPISPRTAERCLEEYRALDARVNRALATDTPNVEDDNADEV